MSTKQVRQYVKLLQYGSPESVAAAIRSDVPEDYRFALRSRHSPESVRDRADQMIQDLS